MTVEVHCLPSTGMQVWLVIHIICYQCSYQHWMSGMSGQFSMMLIIIIMNINSFEGLRCLLRCLTHWSCRNSLNVVRKPWKVSVPLVLWVPPGYFGIIPGWQHLSEELCFPHNVLWSEDMGQMTSVKPNKGCVLELQFASVKILFYSWLQRGDEMDASDPNRTLYAEG